MDKPETVAGTIRPMTAKITMDRVAPDVPLYHYSSTTGLEGIATSKSLYATHYAHLNDYSEVRYGLDQIRNYIGSLIKPMMNGPHASVVPQLWNWLKDGFAGGHNVFVCCFSEKGNLLSQWRGYTPPNKGICLEFDHRRLVALMGQQGFDYCMCEYDRKEQLNSAMQIATKLIDAAIGYQPAGRALAPPEQSYYPKFQEYRDEVLRIAIGMKHEKFEEEREWRFISPQLDDRDLMRLVRFRDGAFSLVPYIPFKLKIQDTDAWPIESVTVGPTPYMNASMTAIGTLLNVHSIRAPVLTCGIPYRA